MKLVISQPMFFPWVGIFEQIKLSDIFVHYDDVQFPQGRSFISRVQIKKNNGVGWLTVPIDHTKSGRLIKDVIMLPESSWRNNHLQTLRHSYAKASHFDEMFELVSDIYSFPTNSLSDFNCNSIEKISSFLELKTKFLRSSELGFKNASTGKLLSICQHFHATEYISGLGAINYLDYSIFEKSSIKVKYMNYEKKTYLQLNGEFTPFVSILDAIANLGKDTCSLICSNAVYWKDFENE